VATNRTGGRAVRRALAGVFAAAALAGCSGGTVLHPVEGTVYLDGNPVQAGERLTGYVVLHADPARGNTNLEDTKGDIGPDGRYTIYTRDQKGAPPGWYLVSVDLARTNPNDPYDYKPLVAAKYLDQRKSGLEFEVVAKPEPGRYDIRLDGLPPKK
jgi:hypothetical protein